MLLKGLPIFMQVKTNLFISDGGRMLHSTQHLLHLVDSSTTKKKPIYFNSKFVALKAVRQKRERLQHD